MVFNLTMLTCFYSSCHFFFIKFLSFLYHCRKKANQVSLNCINKFQQPKMLTKFLLIEVTSITSIVRLSKCRNSFEMDPDVLFSSFFVSFSKTWSPEQANARGLGGNRTFLCTKLIHINNIHSKIKSNSTLIFNILVDILPNNLDKKM